MSSHQEFGVEIVTAWGREVHLTDLDGNRLRRGTPSANSSNGPTTEVRERSHVAWLTTSTGPLHGLSTCRDASPIRATDERTRARLALLRDCLGLEELYRFQDHAGYDGVMLAYRHLVPPRVHAARRNRWVGCHEGEPLGPLPRHASALTAIVERFEAAGHHPVDAGNPYWTNVVPSRWKIRTDGDSYSCPTQGSDPAPADPCIFGTPSRNLGSCRVGARRAGCGIAWRIARQGSNACSLSGRGAPPGHVRRPASSWKSASSPPDRSTPPQGAGGAAGGVDDRLLRGGDWISTLAVGRAMGIPELQLRDLDRWRNSAVYDDAERLVLELAEAMTATPADVAEISATGCERDSLNDSSSSSSPRSLGRAPGSLQTGPSRSLPRVTARAHTASSRRSRPRPVTRPT